MIEPSCKTSCCTRQCGEGRECPLRQTFTPTDAKICALVAFVFVLVLFLPPFLMGWRP